jgi:hypothetical protein
MRKEEEKEEFYKIIKELAVQVFLSIFFFKKTY